MNLEELKAAARNRWSEILSAISGISADVFSSKHSPCPKCEGTDRFRFTDMDGGGSSICNQCGKQGDGIATVQWLLGVDFKEAVNLVADHLGVKLSQKKQPFKKPCEKIVILSASRKDEFAKDFCQEKTGVRPEQLMRCRWAPARWPAAAPVNSQVDVLAFMSYRLPSFVEHSVILYRRNGKNFSATNQISERKTHLLPGLATGNQDGIVVVGSVDEFKAAAFAVKCEGVTDALAAAWLLGEGEIAFANICGAESCEWFSADAFKSKKLVVCGDNDPSGVGLIGANKLAGMSFK